MYLYCEIHLNIEFLAYHSLKHGYLYENFSFSLHCFCNHRNSKKDIVLLFDKAFQYLFSHMGMPELYLFIVL